MVVWVVELIGAGVLHVALFIPGSLADRGTYIPDIMRTSTVTAHHVLKAHHSSSSLTH